MRVSTLEEIFSSSDGKAKKAVLLDQFGVLHDGQKAYPGAVQAVEYLHGLGIRVLIVSNSSRRTTASHLLFSIDGLDVNWIGRFLLQGPMMVQRQS
jgi:ribonucleotide monophosphatase NagD (HAD superfamily)